MSDVLLDIRDLRVSFEVEGRVARAVDGLSLEVRRGQALSLVGESGCGKTVTALAILGLLPPPGRIEGGEIIFRGRNLVGLGEVALRRIRGSEIAMVFQDPTTSLNPVLTVGRQVTEVLRAHRGLSRAEARREAVALLERVAIPSPRERLRAYPHQLSAGMRQRVLLAAALACEPALLLADEPTTSLDVTVQAQILDLIRGARGSTSVLFITHDLGVVAEVADEVLVMYAGRAVERSPATALFDGPLHPYTAGLFASLPRLRAPGEGLRPIPGEVPSPFDPPRGCRFHPRCPFVAPACSEAEPPLTEVAPGRWTACIRIQAGTLRTEDLRAR